MSKELIIKNAPTSSRSTSRDVLVDSYLCSMFFDSADLHQRCKDRYLFNRLQIFLRFKC